jgi:hypothetical protein
MNYRSVEVLTALIFVLMLTVFLFEVPEPEWRHTLVENDTYGKFVDIESYSGKTGISYIESVDSGLLIQEKGSSLLSFGSGWEKEVVDNRTETGMYVSLSGINGRPHLSYQDGSIGEEKLYAAYRKNGEWHRRELDNVTGGGVSVGMYSSISGHRGRPLVLYHSPRQGLKMAEKTASSWDIRQLEEENQGWFTESSSCGDEVMAAYRGDGLDSVRLGHYDGSWESEDTSIKTAADLALDTANCRAHLVYLDPSSESIEYMSPEGEIEKLTDARFSRFSVEATSERVHLAYLDPGDGLTYALKEGSEWSKSTVREGVETGRYNDMALDSEGDIHLAYMEDGDLYHSVLNSGSASLLKGVLTNIQVALAVAFLVLVAILYRNRGEEVDTLRCETLAGRTNSCLKWVEGIVCKLYKRAETKLKQL